MGVTVRIAALSLLPAAGCIENAVGQDPPVYPDSHPQDQPVLTAQDRIVQTVTPVVDALFVIDNSCSMRDEQDALAANFVSFIAFFDGSGLDYHVGVVSTDLDNPQHQGRLQPAGDALWIDESTADPIAAFGEMAALGTSGSGSERGLGATYLALEIHRDTFNAGFYRDDARIDTVLISDEQDQTEETVISEDEFVDWYSGLKRSVSERTFSSIVTMIGPEAGTIYLDVTEEVGGITWDIASNGWDQILERLGLQASGMRREFFLSRLPVVDTISVRVELASGDVLSSFAPATGDPPVGGDYVYDPRHNSVAFLDYIPDPLSTTIIDYEVRTASP